MKEHVNDNQIRDYDVVLDAVFGAPGTPERIEAQEQAFAFYPRDCGDAARLP